MPLPDLKHLNKIIALCRKQGVAEISVDGVTIKLGDAPTKPRRQAAIQGSSTSDSGSTFETDTLTDDALLFWSVGNPADQLTPGE